MLKRVLVISAYDPLSLLLPAQLWYAMAAAKPTPRLASLARWALIAIAMLAILFDLSSEQVFSLEDIAAGDVALLKTLLVIPILMTVLTVGRVAAYARSVRQRGTTARKGKPWVYEVKNNWQCCVGV